MRPEPRAAWFPRGTRPSAELSGRRDWTCVLGTITEHRSRFFSRFKEYATAEHAKYLVLVLFKEFEDDLIGVLDGAPSFQASAVAGLAARDITLAFAVAEPNRGVLETASSDS